MEEEDSYMKMELSIRSMRCEIDRKDQSDGRASIGSINWKNQLEASIGIIDRKDKLGEL